ncbi:MAG: ABC transporter permease [Alphaproteobacteria bacterium]|nr:ABC transporter permease [Alphaproteobacteria bacterium]
MLSLIAHRSALGLLTLLAVSVLVFAGTEILPGDVATAILGQSATPESVAALRHSLGLNDPAILRYWHWLANFLHGDLGTSLANGRPIVEQVGFRLKNTLFLASVAAAVAVPLSVGLGILAAINQNGAFDRIVNVASLSAISLPEFFIGYVLILLVAVQLGWFPSLSAISPEIGLGERLYDIALPAATLTLVVLAHMMRMTRAAIIGVMSHPFIEMAFLKGLARWRIIVEHALPNALAPIINVVAINLAYLVVGVIVVEVVFVYPGIGQLMVDAVSKRDVPVVQACGLIFAGTYVGLNLLADLLAIVTNPLLRVPK